MRLQRKGWQVSGRTDTTCQLRKKKSVDGCLALFLFFLFIIPGIIYLVVASGKEITIFIEVSETGRITFDSPDLTKWQLAQAEKKANNE